MTMYLYAFKQTQADQTK